jgi:UDP-N-acetylmuramoylalanine--D-glutamate ligase
MTTDRPTPTDRPTSTGSLTPTLGPIDLDALTLADVRAGTLRGREVTVLGFARSGIALARFFVDAGATVTVYDGRPDSELADATAALDGRPVRLLAGPDVAPETAWAGAALVATSPSINPDFPTTEPRLRDALQALVAPRAGDTRGTPALVSEADLFLRLCPAPTIGVTGTKGKTTTSSLIAAVLAADPSHPVVLGGNIGLPLIERLADLTPDHRVVIELSELQLPTLSGGTTVAVYTNVTSDHLDRHGSLEGYRRAKRRLAELVDPDGALVLNADDPVVAAYAALGSARPVRYRLDEPLPGGVGVVDDWIVAAGVVPLARPGRGGAAATGEGGRIMPIGELAIPGRHNVSNALAAVATGLLFGLAPDAIRRAAAAFSGVEHRLEPVAVIDGVRFVNDSQGTQPDAVIAALRAFDPPIVIIVGGRDKGVDLTELAAVTAERAAAAVVIGESGPNLARLFGAAGLARIETAPTLDEAVRTADAIARERLTAGEEEPATVLLSPAAASFDMFVDYAARGRAFRESVGRLADERRTRGKR